MTANFFCVPEFVVIVFVCVCVCVCVHVRVRVYTSILEEHAAPLFITFLLQRWEQMHYYT